MEKSPLHKFFRKSATLLVALCACAASAQTMQVISELTDADGNVYDTPMGMCVSPNGRYIAMYVGYSQNVVAIYDTETGESAVFSDEATAENRNIQYVNDDGVGVCINGNVPLIISIDGTSTELPVPDGYDKAAPRYASDDLSIIGGYAMVGDSWSGTSYPCIWRDGEFETLPYPTQDELSIGTTYGAAVSRVSCDGSVLIGYVRDRLSRYPLVVWYRQDDGSYEYDAVCARYVSYSSSTDPDRPYSTLRGSDLSHNGRYVSMDVSVTDEDYGSCRACLYDLETGELTMEPLDEERFADPDNMEIMSTSAVSDDGTILCYLGNDMNEYRQAYIWYPGEEKPVKISERYSDLTDMARFDETSSGITGINTPVDITPDGKRMIGVAYDYDEETLTVSIVTYVIDFDGDDGDGSDDDGSSGISGVTTDGDDTEVARYTLDGMRIGSPVKGVNIVKKADGSTVKVMVK